MKAYSDRNRNLIKIKYKLVNWALNRQDDIPRGVGADLGMGRAVWGRGRALENSREQEGLVSGRNPSEDRAPGPALAPHPPFLKLPLGSTRTGL